MAKNDTKTENLLDILGNGGDASEYANRKANTKTQNYILDAIERIEEIEGGGGGGGGGTTNFNQLTNRPKYNGSVMTGSTNIPKVTTYSAGTNISISNGKISATDTTYTHFTGTNGQADGVAGLVPAPVAADANKYLKSDGTWATVSGSGTDKYLEDVELTIEQADTTPNVLTVDETNTNYVENPAGTIENVPKASNNDYGFVTFTNKEITYTSFTNGGQVYIIIARTTNGIVIVNGSGNAYYVPLSGTPTGKTALNYSIGSNLPCTCTVAEDGSTFTMGTKTYSQSDITTALGNLDTFVKFTNGVSHDKTQAGTVSYTLPQPSGDDKPVMVFTMNDESTIECDMSQIEGFTPSVDEQPLKGLKWNALGDSITDGAHGGISGAGQTYYGLICARQGMTYGNYGVSGTRISSTGTRSANSFVNRYSNMSNDADIITVFGGVNDWGQGGTSDGACAPLGTFGDNTASTVYGALEILCSGLVAKYPTKTILFFTPLGQVGFSGWVGKGADSSIDGGKNAEGYTPWDLADAIKQVCGKYGIPVLDLLREANMTPLDSSQRSTYYYDGLHPSATGYQRLADLMEKKLIEIYKSH